MNPDRIEYGQLALTASTWKRLKELLDVDNKTDVLKRLASEKLGEQV